jgi:archaellum component FlaC
MEAMRESWTDDRLDYLNRRVDDGFKQVDERFKQVDERFRQVDERLGRLEDRIDRIDDRLLTTQRMIIQVGAATIGTMALGFLTVLATTL